MGVASRATLADCGRLLRLRALAGTGLDRYFRMHESGAEARYDAPIGCSERLAVVEPDLQSP